MVVEIIKMSSKGQVVIPRSIREEMHADEGTVFAVIGSEDSVVLKKMIMPSKEELISELSVIAKEGARRAKKLGIKESDASSLVHKLRKEK